MKRRHLQEVVQGALSHFPAVLLTGARQVGKSTLAQSLIGSGWKAAYLTLDDRTVLDAALRDPDGFVSGARPPLVLDEVQRAPDLMRAIKRQIDRDRQPGRFLLTGSANVLTLATVSETLAGRVALLTLYPFSWSEIAEKPVSGALEALFEVNTSGDLLRRLPGSTSREYRDEITQRVLSGGYPVPALMDSPDMKYRWFSSYRETYLERDLLGIRAIENIPDFNRLLALVAFRTGGLLNLSDLSREVGLPFTTLRRFMNLLEMTYQIFLLHPYFANVGKRLIKTPKVYLTDTGMACYLRGVGDWSTLEHQGQTGALVETWAAMEILKLLAVLDPRYRLYFFRSHAGREVDFLVERGKQLVAIEVKWGSSISDSDVANVERCASDLKGSVHFSAILYGGTEVVAFTPKIVGIPFPIFFGIDVLS
ncbi:MAG: hypothetical protein CVU64_15780 [Deltaproteobacteria bacterium HGW-Deltaproteobacteria-21]|nr:MAG: hypothetical protein CVU64_15780 [Deltaproteobacteria bacterium HGW-Deltaproteobacteria-21]